MDKTITVAILTLIILITISPCSLARADNGVNEGWISDKQHLQDALGSDEISDYQKCELIWGTLWRWSKQGNIEARRRLLQLLMPVPHALSIKIPSGEDGAVRDSVIIAAHSLSSTVSMDKDKDTAYSLDEYAISQALILVTDQALRAAFPGQGANSFRNEKFLRCIALNAIFGKPVEQCTKSAVDHGLLPEFNEYAKEVDNRIARGEAVKCNFK